ncbi:spermine oxidase-like [Photinus pyralis]|nr:spermine oxidase-like [Photinus pyralis]
MSIIGRNNPSVIIIGAGAAGIAAASRLYANGFEDITILEAGSRIGGRIHSVPFEGSYIDLGAQWCHGEKKNVVYELVNGLGILKEEDLSPKLYHSSSKVIEEAFQRRFLAVADDLDGAESLAQRIVERFQREVWEDEELVGECLEWLRKSALSYDGAFSWLNVSGCEDFEECEGEGHLSWNGLGYKTILKVLMSKFPDALESKLLLGKEVYQITWGDQVVVSCLDGTTYSADHVIVTPSLGVLKKCHKTLFHPELPLEKVIAIETLGFDAVGKIFLHFPNKWWDQNFTNINFVWSESDLKKSAEEFPCENFSVTQFQKGRSWVTGIFAIHTVLGSPNLLLAWASGEFVPEIETRTDQEIISGIEYILHKFLGKRHSPDAIIREKWYSHPHFYGTYSFQTVQSQKLGRSQASVLRQPLLSAGGKPRVLFAGEATHAKYYSTVHGAIETGHREADRLIDFCK